MNHKDQSENLQLLAAVDAITALFLSEVKGRHWSELEAALQDAVTITRRTKKKITASM